MCSYEECVSEDMAREQSGWGTFISTADKAEWGGWELKLLSSDRQSRRGRTEDVPMPMYHWPVKTHNSAINGGRDEDQMYTFLFHRYTMTYNAH